MAANRSVIVAGNGPVAWIAALGLWRAFRNQQLEVQVVDTGASDDLRIGRWTLPSQRGMHALLGIPEPHLVQHTGATFKLATEHLGWQGEGSRFLHAHGEIGKEIGSTPFYKFIQREVLAGRPERPEAFSVAGVAARTAKFARPMGDGHSLTASFTYGFHLEEAAYTQYLRAHALRQGVKRRFGRPGRSVAERAWRHQALRLTDGSTASADFFLDCSGPAARLLGSVSSGDREDWSQWLPCDRMWSGLSPPASDPPAITQTMATEAGLVVARAAGGRLNGWPRLFAAGSRTTRRLNVPCAPSGRLCWARPCSLDFPPDGDARCGNAIASRSVPRRSSSSRSRARICTWRRSASPPSSNSFRAIPPAPLKPPSTTTSWVNMPTRCVTSRWPTIARGRHARENSGRPSARQPLPARLAEKLESVRRERAHQHARSRELRGNGLGLAAHGQRLHARVARIAVSSRSRQNSRCRKWTPCARTFNRSRLPCRHTSNSSAARLHSRRKRRADGNHMQHKVRKIVIVGGGTAGWMTAAAFAKMSLGARVFDRAHRVGRDRHGGRGRSHHSADLRLQPHPCRSTRTSSCAPRRRASSSASSSSTGTRRGESYIHPFGYYGVQMHGIYFHHFWLRHRAQGGTDPPEVFNHEHRRLPPGTFGKPLPDDRLAAADDWPTPITSTPGLYAALPARHRREARREAHRRQDRLTCSRTAKTASSSR